MRRLITMKLYLAWQVVHHKFELIGRDTTWGYKDRRLHPISEDTRIKEQGYSLGEDIVVERFSLNEDQHNVRGTP